MFGILDNIDEDAGKTIAFGIGTFIMTAVMLDALERRLKNEFPTDD